MIVRVSKARQEREQKVIFRGSREAVTIKALEIVGDNVEIATHRIPIPRIFMFNLGVLSAFLFCCLVDLIGPSR